MAKVGRKGKIEWNDEQIEILRTYYPLRDYDTLFERLGVNIDALRHKAMKLGITVDNYDFTEEEVKFLKENFKTMKYSDIATVLNKTTSSVQIKINRLGLIKSERWTEEEMNLLKDVYPLYPNEYLIRVYFPNRKMVNMRTMALKNGLRKSIQKGNRFYDPKEIIQKLSDLGKKLNRTPSIDELVSNGLPSDATYRRYFGGYRDACELAELEINCDLFGNAKKYYSSKRDLCFSKSELLITEFFIENNIEYKKDVPYSEICSDARCGTKRTDWVLNDGSVIEYWGYPKVDSYIPGVQIKIEICKDNNINLIQLVRKDLTKLRNIFVNYL